MKRIAVLGSGALARALIASLDALEVDAEFSTNDVIELRNLRCESFEFKVCLSATVDEKAFYQKHSRFQDKQARQFTNQTNRKARGFGRFNNPFVY